jgi:hypothetical protein
MRKTIWLYCFVFLNLSFVVHSVELLPPGIHGPIESGVSKGLYKVLVPTAANEGKPLPVLYLAGWGYIPKLEAWKEWAERERVIVVGIFDFFGIGSSNSFASLFEANRQSLEARVRAHPYFRVGIGSQRSAAFMLSLTKAPLSGIAMTIGFNTELKTGSFSITEGQPLHAHHVLVFDSERPNLWLEAEERHKDAQKNKMNLVIDQMPNIGDAIPVVAIQQEWATHAFDRVLSSHPLIKPEELQAGQQRLSQRITDIDKMTVLQDKVLAFRLLYSVPAMNDKHPDYIKFMELYMTALLSAPEEKNDYELYKTLSSMPSKAIAKLSSTVQSTYKNGLKRVQGSKAVKAEILAYKEFEEVRNEIISSENSKNIVERGVKRLEKLVKEHPATIGGRRAATVLPEYRSLIR